MNSQMTLIEEYLTSNIYLVAFLVINGGRIDQKRIDRSDSKHVKIMVVGPRLTELAESWMEPDNLARKYSETLKDIKAMVHC